MGNPVNINEIHGNVKNDSTNIKVDTSTLNRLAHQYGISMEEVLMKIKSGEIKI